ncbi:hypothetical protein, partial [Vibrio vulnificus]|uniref:hypothetical protein n=2 Tax=Vibrionaceae TaxID=641 RepID=UPI001A7E102F
PTGRNMTLEIFLASIYDQISVGMKIDKPKVISEILEIYSNGNIYYRVGAKNKKFVSRSELSALFDLLDSGNTVTSKHIRSIIPSSKPCNATTIKWLLKRSDLVGVNDKDEFSRKW